MKRLTENRIPRWLSLPYAVLLLTVVVGYGFVSIGQAGEVIEELVVTAYPLAVTDALEIRDQIKGTAGDAAWRTRISVASKLSARLNVQRRPYRIASKGNDSSKQTG